MTVLASLEGMWAAVESMRCFSILLFGEGVWVFGREFDPDDPDGGVYAISLKFPALDVSIDLGEQGGVSRTAVATVQGDQLVVTVSVGDQVLIVQRFRRTQGLLQLTEDVPQQTIVDEKGETVVLSGEQVVSAYRASSTKQVLVYRRDLKMRKGKIAAQCAHGSMAVFFRRKVANQLDQMTVPLDGPMAHWSHRGFAKIVLSVDDEADLLKVHELAQARGLPTALITDAGKTEFGGVPTRTVVAVGPAVVEEIDTITGKDGLVTCKLA